MLLSGISLPDKPTTICNKNAAFFPHNFYKPTKNSQNATIVIIFATNVIDILRHVQYIYQENY